MRGRPTKLNEATSLQICDAVKGGMWAETAAALAGIDDATYYRWIAQAAAGKEPYVEFREALKRAEAQAEQGALVRIHMGEDNWQSSAWFLERRFPKRWSRRDADHELKTKLLEADLKRSKAELELIKAKLKEVAQGDTREPLEIRIVPFELKQPSE